MFTVTDFDEALKALEDVYLHDLQVRKDQYLQDREALEKVRDAFPRFRVHKPLIEVQSFARKAESIPYINGIRVSVPAQPVVSKRGQRKRKARDIVREVTLQMPETFTVKDVFEKAKQSEDPEVRGLDEGSYSSTFYWFKKKKLVDVVREGTGKGQGTVYRILNKELRPLETIKRNTEFPLMDMVLEAVNTETSSFGKQIIYEKVREMFPEYGDRIKADSVSATLFKLTLPPINKIRRVTQSHAGQGNVYEKLST